MQAVLFDLDGTLLESNFDAILKGYFAGVAKRFEPWIEREKFNEGLMVSTKIMMANENSTRTNIDVFAADFFPRVDLDPQLMEVFDRYYVTDFPALKDRAMVSPYAKQIVESAFAHNNKVVIATNPVFPETAITERLRWAEIADYPYDLITHGENMHACKPSVKYYEEICARIGVQPEQCLMIGDDLVNDGVVTNLGMDFFHITSETGLDQAMEYMLAKKE